jgi:hypothetical protein
MAYFSLSYQITGETQPHKVVVYYLLSGKYKN